MTFLRSRTNSDWINVFSGTRFHPFDPRDEEIHLVDIAHATGRACRYAGHTPLHYSVAEHAVLVAEAVRLLGGTIEEQRWGLLHDATEAYLVDLPNPIKRHPGLTFYVELEDMLMAQIASRFKLHQTTMPDIVKQCDKEVFSLEVGTKGVINKIHDDFRWALPVPGVNLDPRLVGLTVQNLDPEKATAWWLKTFHALFAGTEFQKEALEAAQQRGLVLDGIPAQTRGMLIGVGHRKRSGKDETAKAIMQRVPYVKRMAFADLLKAGVNVWHGWDERHSDGELKEVVDPYWGYSPRYAYVNIGTDCIRDRHRQDFWVKAAMRVVNMWRDAGYTVIITDIRFPDEADVVKAAGGVVWKASRPSLPPLDMENDHISETALAKYEGWDEVLDNSSSLEDFHTKVLVAFVKATLKAALDSAEKRR